MSWLEWGMWGAAVLNLSAAVWNIAAGMRWNRTRTKVLADYDIAIARIECLAIRERVVVDLVNADAATDEIRAALAVDPFQ